MILIFVIRCFIKHTYNTFRLYKTQLAYKLCFGFWWVSCMRLYWTWENINVALTYCLDILPWHIGINSHKINVKQSHLMNVCAGTALIASLLIYFISCQVLFSYYAMQSTTSQHDTLFTACEWTRMCNIYIYF